MKPKLGNGQRFAKLKAKLSENPKIHDPGAVAAAIGRKVYGQEKMTKMAQSGKKRHEK